MRPLLITEQVVTDLEEMAEAASPCETGGILVGVKARRTIWVVGAIELYGDRTPEQYRVPPGVTHAAVDDARKTIDPRVGYVGEWHTHTSDEGPSSMDRDSMRGLSYFVSWPGAGGLCLVLVRRTEAGWVVDAHRARFPSLRPAALVQTGPLPP